MNSNKNFISIITPNYNGKKFLSKTLKSVFNQTCNDFEYIVLDSLSNDGSQSILKKYKKKIDRLIIRKDKGIYDAVEKGIRMAQGEVIIWINSDDILHPDAVKNVKKIFKKNKKIEWACGINGYIKYGLKYSLIPYIYPKFLIRHGLARHTLWGYIQQESCAFRKSLFIKSGGFGKKPTLAGDYKLWIKFSKIAKLHTFFFHIGYFRTWSGQASQIMKKEYLKHSNTKYSFFSLRVIRFIISLIFLPYIFLKTKFLIK